MESSLTFLSYFLHFTLNLRQIVAILPSRYTQNPTTFLLALTPPGCKSPSPLTYCVAIASQLFFLLLLVPPRSVISTAFRVSISNVSQTKIPFLLRMANASLCHSVETTVLKNGPQSLMPTASLPNLSDHVSYYSSH